MEVKEAIARAKAYVKDVFSDEPLTEPTLEETEYRDGTWRITVSFSLPRPPAADASAAASALGLIIAAQGEGRRRIFKVVFINDQDGSVSAMKDRAWMERVE